MNRGIHALILGEAGIGKTSLLRTIPPEEKILFVDIEGGSLAVSDLRVDTITPQTWDDCRAIFSALAPGNPALEPSNPYSESQAAVYAQLNDFSQYTTIYVDSLTVASRLLKIWAKQTPEGKGKNKFAVWSVLGEEMVGTITHLHRSPKNIFITSILEEKQNDRGETFWQPQIDGSQAQKQIPGIFDLVLTMSTIAGAESKTYRCLYCDKTNRHGYPAKDRSGSLNAVENPHLGYIINKIRSNQKVAHSYEIPQDTANV